MITRTNKRSLLDNRSNFIRVDQCLVRPMVIPRGGWGVKFIINKVPLSVTGNRPNEVFSKANRVLRDNDVELSSYDLWFTLNTQWMDRVKDGDMLVPKSLMREAAINGDEQETPQDYHHPSTWGSIQWRALAHYLNVDPKYYRYEELCHICDITLKLLNPVTAPRFGCADCLREFSNMYHTMRLTPIHRLEEARQWVWSVHNKVNEKIGKEVISYEKAKQLNHWD